MNLFTNINILMIKTLADTLILNHSVVWSGKLEFLCLESLLEYGQYKYFMYVCNMFSIPKEVCVGVFSPNSNIMKNSHWIQIYVIITQNII